MCQSEWSRMCPLWGGRRHAEMLCISKTPATKKVIAKPPRPVGTTGPRLPAPRQARSPYQAIEIYRYYGDPSKALSSYARAYPGSRCPRF